MAALVIGLLSVGFATGLTIGLVYGARIRKELGRQGEDVKEIGKKLKEIGDVIIHD
jgi:hypothetical protein